MAVTITKPLVRPVKISRDFYFNIALVNLSDESYVSGGISLDFRNFLRSLNFTLVEGVGGYSFEYDSVNKKLKIYTAQGTEASGSLTLTFRVIFFGRA